MNIGCWRGIRIFLINSIPSLLYRCILLLKSLIFLILLIKVFLLNRQSILSLAVWLKPPIGPPPIIPERLVRFKKKVDQAKSKQKPEVSLRVE